MCLSCFMDDFYQTVERLLHFLLQQFESGHFAVLKEEEDMYHQLLLFDYKLQRMFLQSVVFPQQSFDPVSVHCFFKMPGAYAKTRFQGSRFFPQ